MRLKFHVAIIACTFLADPADAALISRMGGKAYYDDVQNVTWLRYANWADIAHYGIPGVSSSGLMTWATANQWIAALNGAGILGQTDWRMPTISDLGTPGCNYAYSGTDCGYNMDVASGELAHLYYSTLGNAAYCMPSGLCDEAGDTWDWGMNNRGPFVGVGWGSYWSSTSLATNNTRAWVFDVTGGAQFVKLKAELGYVWAVRTGDTLHGTLPVPATLWLMSGAIGALALVRNARSRTESRAA
jgi:hypothetical protein